MNQPLQFKVSKKKLIFPLLVYTVLAAGGIWTLYTRSIAAQGTVAQPVFSNWITILTTVLCGILAIVFAGRMLNNKIPLIADEKGLHDNASRISAPFIPWEDIKGFDSKVLRRQRLLIVMLKNPEEYTARATTFLQKKLISINEAEFGTPITIPVNSLEYSMHEIQDKLQQMLDERKRGGGMTPPLTTHNPPPANPL